MKLHKIFFILGMLTIIPFCLNAQKVSLRNQSLQLPESDYYISRVVDCRHELSDSDLAQRRLSISTSQFYFEDNLGQFIFNMCKLAIKDTIGKIPVILKVNWFKFETDDFEIFLGANFDFYTLINDKIYYEFKTGNYRDINPKKNYTGFEEEQAVAIIEQSYQEFLHRMKNKLGYHKTVQEDAILHNSILNEVTPNFTVSPPKSGLYYSFNNFRDNLADTIKQFTSRLKQDGKRTFNINAGGIEQVWAVAYYDETYLNYKGHSVPLIEKENGYLINMKIKHKVSGSAWQGVKVGSIVYGATSLVLLVSTGATFTPLAGLLIIGIGTGIGAAIPKYETLDVNSQIDMFTGRLIPIRKYQNPKVFKSHSNSEKFIFYFPQRFAQDLEISIDSSKPLYFKASSYYTYRANKEVKKVGFCIKSKSDMFCDTLYAGKDQNHHYYIYLSNNDSIKCEAIDNPKTIEKYNRRIEHGTMKELKR